MEGTDGNDYLFGTEGDDLIDLGLGMDVVNGSAGNDVIKGGDNGYNQIDYDGEPADYAFYSNDDGSVTPLVDILRALDRDDAIAARVRHSAARATREPRRSRGPAGDADA